LISRDAGTFLARRVSSPTRFLVAIVIPTLLLGAAQPAWAALTRGKDVRLNFPAYDIAAADFNGDGGQDLALTDKQHSVWVLKGRGDGTFKSASQLTLGNGPQNLAVGDFNSDGRKDIVVPNFKGRNISVLLGRGHGKFKPRSNYRTGTGPVDVAIARLNHDHHPDLVVANVKSNDVSVLLGRGDGTFRRKHDYNAGYEPRSVVIADLNRDQSPDLAVADDAKITVLNGQGDVRFKRLRDIPMRDTLYELLASDLNHDGAIDLAVSNIAYNSSQGIHVLRGRGKATFGGDKQYSFDSSVSHFTISNVLGGSRKDLIAETEGYPLDLDNDPGYLYVMQGHRDGTFTSGVTKKLDGDGGRFAVADLNGDGKRDIAAITYAPAPKIEVFLGG
jgi:hypothetical protein